jgi:hypothetical protein
MDKLLFQFWSTREIRELAKKVARRHGMKLGQYMHRLLAKEDPELAELIEEQLGIAVERSKR